MMRRPRTVLVGWELGGGRGHLETLRPVIVALAMAGWRVRLAARDLALARTMFATPIEGAPFPLELCQAPIFLHPATRPPAPLFSLAEIMAHAGFADPHLLGPVVGAWGRLIDRFDPDVVVVEAAPSLRVAAQGRVPVITVGGPWTVPPDIAPVPALPVTGYNSGVAATAETDILSAIEVVSASRWRPGRFASVLRGDHTFVCCHPVLDVYTVARREKLWWPPNIEPPLKLLDLQRSVVFAYLPKNHYAHDLVIAALEQNRLEAIAYLGGRITQPVANLKISPTPVRLSSVLPRSACVIHHGGLGIATWCLAFGISQIALPSDLEKSVYARLLSSTQYGAALSSNCDAGSLATLIKNVVSQGRLSIQGPRPEANVTDAIIAACHNET